MVIPFLPCSSTCVTGQAGSGKTRFVFQLLKTVKDMYVEDPPKEIIYCFGIHQPMFEEMEKNILNITFHQGLPSPEDVDNFTADRRHRLIVLDDMMHRVVQNVDMKLLFTQGCHRRVHHREHFPPSNEIENHRIKHDISRHDEKRKRRIQDIDGGVCGRHPNSRRITGGGHVTSFGRHIQTENTRVPGTGPDSVLSQTCIRGRTRDEQEK